MKFKLTVLALTLAVLLTGCGANTPSEEVPVSSNSITFLLH